MDKKVKEVIQDHLVNPVLLVDQEEEENQGEMVHQDLLAQLEIAVHLESQGALGHLETLELKDSKVIVERLAKPVKKELQADQVNQVKLAIKEIRDLLDPLVKLEGLERKV